MFLGALVGVEHTFFSDYQPKLKDFKWINLASTRHFMSCAVTDHKIHPKANMRMIDSVSCNLFAVSDRYPCNSFTQQQHNYQQHLQNQKLKPERDKLDQKEANDPVPPPQPNVEHRVPPPPSEHPKSIPPPPPPKEEAPAPPPPPEVPEVSSPHVSQTLLPKHIYFGDITLLIFKCIISH